MSDDGADPFKCPRCGERDVTVHGSGRKDCQNCEYEYRPVAENPTNTTEQSGILDY